MVGIHTMDKAFVDACVASLGGLGELPFTVEDHPKMLQLLDKAVIAVECESSLWRARQMPDYETPLKPQKRLGGRLGLRKAAVLPTIIIKEEDLGPRQEDWQRRGFGV